MTLAAAAPASTSAWDQPGTIAFLIVFGMCVVMYFVFRSMSRHLRKINEAARLEAEQAGAASSATSGVSPAASGPATMPARDDYERQQSEQNAIVADLEF